MTDRYLYRAKRKSDKKWIYGNLIQTDDGVYIIQNYVPQHLIGKYDVDPSTICQCTGLNDKNGKLILENDIVSANGTLYVCRFDEENFEWEFQNREETIGICCFHSSDIEITGNAIDNPELLEVGE